MTWTERYLAAALRSIPEKQRADVERELRSSIEDGVEERLAAGEDAATAERAVLEGLGDPEKLAASYTGRPSFLIGPELYPLWKSTILRIVAVSLPFAVVILSALALMDGGNYGDVILAAFSGAIDVPIQILFWGTVAFAIVERADATDPVRVSIMSKAGPWKLEHLPELSTQRVTRREAAGEIVNILVAAAVILFMDSLKVPGPNGANGLLHGDFTGFVFPVVMVALLVRAGLQVFAVVAGRWTMYFATLNALLHLVFAVPIVWLAATSRFFDPYFAAGIGWPGLAEVGGWPTLTVAVATTLLTAWEIVRGFNRARGSSVVHRLLPTRHSA